MLLHTLNNVNKDEQNLQFLEPFIRRAVQELRFSPGAMALIIDRHKAIKQQKQIYGSYWEMGDGKRTITP